MCFTYLSVGFSNLESVLHIVFGLASNDLGPVGSLWLGLLLMLAITMASEWEEHLWTKERKSDKNKKGKICG